MRAESFVSSADRRSDAVLAFEVGHRDVEVRDGENEMIDDGHAR